MAGRNFLAFDLGAESGRAVLGTLDNGRLTLEEKHRFANPTGRMNGHLHWNLLAQWEELKTGLKNAASGPPLTGLGVDTWGVDYGLIGPVGNVLGNPYHYRDSRTDGVMERAFAKVPREQIFQATGIQFMQLNTLYQLMAMREQNSQALEIAQTLLFMPDLFNFLFTGVRKSEFSIATTSQMYDPRQRDWARPMLEQLGIPTRILPEIVPSGTIIGPLSDDVAEECGVGPLPVIAPACHDTGSAVAAVPVEETGDDWCYISSGTWSLMGVELAEPVINERSLRYNYTNEGGVGGTFRFLKNIMGLWLVQECRRQFKKEGYEHTYAELTQMAGRAKGLAALIDPDHAPFLTPGEMPQKIDRFCEMTKQPKPGNRGDYVRTCLDSLALTYRRTLEGLEDILGRRINTIHIVGGGTQNELLSQMTADACNRVVIAGPVEATGIGNILVQAMATGDVKSLADARAIVRNSFDVKRYEPRETKRWDEAYARFRSLKPMA
ncbi:MAG TPA: rhamnulokinase family protein [Tepidisphaeraceae bacterium]|nr:rhamnulokinase family protein [Tepidisphaeraceae bacterium]